MRMRTVFAITLTMFALPALAAELPPVMPAPRELPSEPPVMPAGETDEPSVSFEVRTLKVPVGFRERIGLKLTGNTVLTDADLRRVLEAAQGQRDATITHCPKVTAFDGQEATVRNCEQRSFVTSLEVTKVKGQTVFVPKNTPIELGDTLTVSGRVSTDGQTVAVRAKLVRRFVAGDVELVPVTTQITPVFEGGSQGKPIPFTQFLQTPDVKTEQVEKNVIISADATIVLGSWKETGERPAKPKGLLKKEPPAPEYEVVTLATVRVLRAENVAPMPHEARAGANKSVLCKLQHVAAADAAQALKKYLDGKNLNARLAFDAASNNVHVSGEPEVVEHLLNILAKLDEKAAPTRMCQVVKLRNIAAADAAQALNKFLTSKKWNVVVVEEAVSNTLLVSAEPASFQQTIDLITALDKAPIQVAAQVTVMQVPRGFLAQAGMEANGPSGQGAWTLSPREVKMFTGLIRAAKERGECDILSRPQLCLNDNQTGFVQVGQNFPVVTEAEVKLVGGEAKPVPQKIEYWPTGFSMKLTPRVSPDGKSVLLRTDAQLTTVSPVPVALGDPKDPKTAWAPVFNTQSVNSTTEVRTGDTLVLALVGGETGGRSFLGAVRRHFVADKYETVVIVTPHVVRSEADNARVLAEEADKTK